MSVDRDRLRRLALLARDDDRDEVCALRVSPAQLELALALDPATVLELLDRLRVTEAALAEVRERVRDSTHYRDEMLAILEEEP